jgi:hypothetical protein
LLIACFEKNGNRFNSSDTPSSVEETPNVTQDDMQETTKAPQSMTSHSHCGCVAPLVKVQREEIT